MNHTKGEWKATTYQGQKMIEADRNGRKCWVAQGLYDDENEPTLAELQANANLIASAPDLYEALKAINASKEPMDDTTIVNAMVGALRKAEGRL